MELDEIRDAFLELHDDATQLVAEVQRTPSRWTIIVRHWRFRKIEHRFVGLSRRFAELDSQLNRHMKLPKDYDSAVRTTATFDLYDAVREAVRGLLSEARAALDSLRSHAHPSAWVAMAVIGLAVAIGLLVAIVVMAR